MFKIFYFSELKYAFKQPMIYIFLGLITLLVFGAVSSDNVMIGGSVGNVFRNSPYIVTTYTTIMTIFGLLIATAFFNNAALRDYKSGFNEIIFTTPLSKSGFYFGRFFGALILSTVPMLGVFIGVILGSLIAPAMGWIDPSRFGQINWLAFSNNYLLFILPNMFFAGAVIFAIANKWRNTVLSFVGTLIIIIGYIVSGVLMSDIDNELIASLTDTFGIRAYSIFTKYYTPTEKNSIVPLFEGMLLLNRLIWIGIGAIVLALSYFSFSFREKSKKVKAESKSEFQESIRSSSIPVFASVYNSATIWHQFRSFFYTNLLSITKNVTFIILFLFSAIILLANLMGGFDYFGLQSYPVTYKVIDVINNAATIYVVIILVFFSGELVWRDRDYSINEVIDATPHASLVSLSSKVLSLLTITFLLHAFFILVGVLYQLAKGYTRIELDVYFLDYFYTNFFTYFTWAGIMILIQVLSNNKYVGYFISIAFIFISDIIWSIMDVESNMLSIAGTPSLRYSDMNGYGPGLSGAMWFNAYWTLFSLICLMIASALWSRGTASQLSERIAIVFKSLSRRSIIYFGTTCVIWLLLLGFVYYNTQVLNTYQTSDENELAKADYEKKYKRYEAAQLPKIKDVKYNIDIFPEDRDVFVEADIIMKNESDLPIDSIFFTYDKKWEPEINIPNSSLIFDDSKNGFINYKLNEPLLPNEEVLIKFKTQYVSRGFENDRGNTNIIRNGTFINNFEILPSLGYQDGMELSEKNTRKKYDLEPKARTAKLEYNCTGACEKNYLSNGKSDFINVESTISTSEDQIAIGPGSLIKKWNEKGRNFYHYKIDHPSLDFYSFISGDFEVAKRRFKNIEIEVYYDSEHAQNIEMMMDAVERSLDYYTKNFGPYYHKQCRIIEFPRYETFAQAFPGTMPYSESIGFIINLEDETENNVVDAVIAHEMAHQWWAHQVIGASMQGGTMMSESFAEYSSLMTMKGISENSMKMREFLKYDHDRYLRGRSDEIEKELPLYKVENQAYIHYGKGSVILYALQDYIGEEKVNNAMRNFLSEYKYKTPYPTSLDFLKHLEPEVPDSLKYLITDWFKEITLYDNRLSDATYKKLTNGKYEINVDVFSNRIKADSLGNEIKYPSKDWIEIGVFADNDEKELIYSMKYFIDQENTSLTILVAQEPAKVGIDPRHLLIDRVFDDNIKPVDKVDE